MKKIISFVYIFIMVMSLFGEAFALEARKLPSEKSSSCALREVRAKELSTGKIGIYTSPCFVPEGWVEMGRSGYAENAGVVREIKNASIMKISIPESLKSRKFFAVSRDYSFDEVNTTYAPDTKILHKGRYSLVGLDSKEKGEIYLKIQANASEKREIILYVRYADGKEKPRYSVIKFHSDMGSQFQNDKIASGNYSMTQLD